MIDTEFQEISCCRICKSSEMVLLFDLGSIPLTGIFPISELPDPISSPLTLVKCTNCKLVQLLHSVNPDIMFGADYGYRTSLNPHMQKHIEGTALKIRAKFPFEHNSAVLDIGSNDGTLLNYWRELDESLNLVGMDPSAIDLRDSYHSSIHLVCDFFSAELSPMKNYQVITSIAMFYDLEDPIKFAQGIKACLANNGIWYLEQSYLFSMLQLNSFDTICHEHLEYYSVTSMQAILEPLELQIIDFDLNDANGGSIGFYVAHLNGPYTPDIKVQKQKKFEDDNTERLEKSFLTQVPLIKSQVQFFIEKEMTAGRNFWGVGASTKGNTILHYFNLTNNEIVAIADKNPNKNGKVTPGTRIPIVPANKLLEEAPDYSLILPWHFKDYILKDEVLYLKNNGTLLTPLPNFEQWSYGSVTL